MNTHSRVADCRCEIFAAHSALAGASQEQVEQIMKSITTDEIGGLLQKFKIDNQVYESILKKTEYYLNQRVAFNCRIEVIMFTKQGEVFYQTPGAQLAIENLKKCC